MSGRTPLGDYPANHRVTDGARTRGLLSATIRCRPLQSILVRPVIRLIYAIFSNSEDYFYPLRTSLYQPGCSTVAVNVRRHLL
jgi:hypothetical protein